MLNKIKTPLIYIFLIVSLGFTIRYFMSSQVQAASSQSTQALYTTHFSDLNGHQQTLTQYKGKFIVLNFWATWCEPCREEMPELSALHESYLSKNVVVLGLAIDDLTAIAEFQKQTPVKYPLFAADMQGMEIATNLGNNKGVLPYTVIIKPDGSVHRTYFGRVSKALLEQSLAPLLKKINPASTQ
ncbi:MAG TPA: redoxin [Methylophilaceae bacterium]|nr:redoxin [Methylophilaceae bacterium]HAJ72868.1 redoxin [Methylophilaceae bacterium]